MAGSSANCASSGMSGVAAAVSSADVTLPLSVNQLISPAPLPPTDSSSSSATAAAAVASKQATSSAAGGAAATSSTGKGISVPPGVEVIELLSSEEDKGDEAEDDDEESSDGEVQAGAKNPRASLAEAAEAAEQVLSALLGQETEASLSGKMVDVTRLVGVFTRLGSTGRTLVKRLLTRYPYLFVTKDDAASLVSLLETCYWDASLVGVIKGAFASAVDASASENSATEIVDAQKRVRRFVHLVAALLEPTSPAQGVAGAGASSSLQSLSAEAKRLGRCLLADLASKWPAMKVAEAQFDENAGYRTAVMLTLLRKHGHKCDGAQSITHGAEFFPAFLRKHGHGLLAKHSGKLVRCLQRVDDQAGAAASSSSSSSTPADTGSILAAVQTVVHRVVKAGLPWASLPLLKEVIAQKQPLSPSLTSLQSYLIANLAVAWPQPVYAPPPPTVSSSYSYSNLSTAMQSKKDYEARVAQRKECAGALVTALGRAG